MNTTTKLIRFLRLEDGRSAIEYAIMIGLVVGVVGLGVNSLTNRVSTTFDDTAMELNKVLSDANGVKSYHEQRQLIISRQQKKKER